MKSKLLLLSILVSFFQISSTLHAEQLNRVTSVKNSSIASNQIAFSTENIPAGASVTAHCSFNNQADFSGYVITTPFSGSFSGIDYKTCWTSGCGIATGSVIYLGLANTLINIYGVSRANQAIILTNYSSQSLYVSCWF